MSFPNAREQVRLCLGAGHCSRSKQDTPRSSITRRRPTTPMRFRIHWSSAPAQLEGRGDAVLRQETGMVRPNPPHVLNSHPAQAMLSRSGQASRSKTPARVRVSASLHGWRSWRGSSSRRCRLRRECQSSVSPWCESMPSVFGEIPRGKAGHTQKGFVDGIDFDIGAELLQASP